MFDGTNHTFISDVVKVYSHIKYTCIVLYCIYASMFVYMYKVYK